MGRRQRVTAPAPVLGKMTPGWQRSWGSFTMLHPLQRKEGPRRTGGGPRSHKGQNPRRRTRRRTSTSPAYSWVSPREKNNDAEPARPQAEAAVALSGEGHQTPEGEPGDEKRGPPPGGALAVADRLLRRKPRRRMLRRKKTSGQCEEWETVRMNAWLRELCTDSSEGEYMRFKESGRWIANMTGNRDKGQCDSDAG